MISTLIHICREWRVQIYYIYTYLLYYQPRVDAVCFGELGQLIKDQQSVKLGVLDIFQFTHH